MITLGASAAKSLPSPSAVGDPSTRKAGIERSNSSSLLGADHPRWTHGWTGVAVETETGRMNAHGQRVEALSLLEDHQYNCPCPISVHPLKGVEKMAVARDVSQANGCAIDNTIAGDGPLFGTGMCANALTDAVAERMGASERLQALTAAEGRRVAGVRAEARRAYHAYRARQSLNQSRNQLDQVARGGLCAHGIVGGGGTDAYVCCRASCGKCGGPGCSTRPGGPSRCCPLAILRAGRTCITPAMVSCAF